jgi:endonuclease/exonuclease/phosphatase family metal-dependent hydrolase
MHDATPQAAPHTAPRRLKLLSYNILDGGVGRLDPIYETLLHLDADVIALQEADGDRAAAYLAHKLGFDHILAQSLHSPHHVAILSRQPIEQAANLTIRFDHLNRPALTAIVPFAGSSIRIVTLHLPPHYDHEDDRLRDLLPVLDFLSQGPQAALPTVIMGDFNASAPYHPIDRAAMKPKRRALLESIGSTPRFDVVNTMLTRGFIDAYHHLNPSHPRHTFTTGYPADRVDYIWLSPDLLPRLAASDIETGGFAPYCSDHYPIWATLRA